MALTLEALLAPIDGDDPAGPDLYDDPQREEIKRAFERPVSVDPTAVADRAAVDWRAVVRAIEEQSARTRDIWLPVYLCRAGAWWGRLDLVRLGAEYLAGMVETCWETMYPKLDDLGFLGRKSPCESLTKVADFLEPLRQTVILDHPRLGKFSGAQFEAQQRGDDPQAAADFRDAVKEADPATLAAAVAQLDAITVAVRRVDTVLISRAEDESATNFGDTYTALASLRGAVAAVAPEAQPPEPPSVVDPPERAPGDRPKPPPSPGVMPAGAVNSRDDVLKALDAIAGYYQREEPTSPVPMLLDRAREWVKADFLTILQDIAPGSLDDARRVLVSQSKRESG